MKYLILTLCGLFVYTLSDAQQFSGTATFKSSSQIELSLDSTAMSPQQMQALKQQLMKKMQKTYKLKFNAKESLWEQEESVDSGPAKASSGGMELAIMDGSSKDKMYRNLEAKEYRNSQEIMGKRFLIVDSLPNYEWEITNESKKIGDYNCQKAIYTRISDAKRFATGMDEMEVIKDTTKVEAWFTMDIPVAHGPVQYFGLPGLILELKSNGRHFICTEVSMNYKEVEEIKVPDQGKVVTNDEFESISEEKMKEMMQRYQGHGNDSNIEIVIGG
ncbi:GLPGLI family protein [Marivirga arenosa]|uniref:GLPGLI family protein n=1 Tax=Marivirga arenosa TaxID=3059076 RepID=A0AA51N7J9_9BACT|nr:GLPGLI family protein [Marivirga sp. ABR2-2]WMN07468.1 GLPGLI family protein [Marivirga sp. ABR2-2]